MVDVIRYAKENPNSINRLSANDDDDTGLIAGSLSDVTDADGATHTSVSVDVTRVGGTQPIPITLSVEAAQDHHDNLSQTASAPHTSMLTLSVDSQRPAGSLSAEMSDAEYYTPLGSPDESRQSLAVNTDEITAASALSAALAGKVISWSSAMDADV